MTDCDTVITQLETTIKQHEAIKDKLSSLPDKTRYNIQVPVGSTFPGQPPLLLMKGYIKHTNEILVLLGDNWFVERSAKESVDIIDRRISRTRILLEKYKEEKKQHQQWLDFVETMDSDHKDLVDIKEESDSAKEEEWMQKHRQRVKEYKLKETSENIRNPDDDLDIMTRLSILEEEEEQLEREKELKTSRERKVIPNENSKELKSILKKTIVSESKVPAATTREEMVVTDQVPSTPFTGQVVEREPGQETKHSLNVNDPPHSVSRFKASRTKK